MVGYYDMILGLIPLTLVGVTGTLHGIGLETAIAVPLALAVAALVTYAWRGLGVLLSGRIDPDGPLFAWTACVAYALLAALIARMIVLPRGDLADTAALDRILAFDPDTPPLATQLSDDGYRTAGISGNVWISPEFGFDAGLFDEPLRLRVAVQRRKFLKIFPVAGHSAVSPWRACSGR